MILEQCRQSGLSVTVGLPSRMDRPTTSTHCGAVVSSMPITTGCPTAASCLLVRATQPCSGLRPPRPVSVGSRGSSQSSGRPSRHEKHCWHAPDACACRSAAWKAACAACSSSGSPSRPPFRSPVASLRRALPSSSALFHCLALLLVTPEVLSGRAKGSTIELQDTSRLFSTRTSARMPAGHVCIRPRAALRLGSGGACMAARTSRRIASATPADSSPSPSAHSAARMMPDSRVS